MSYQYTDTELLDIDDPTEIPDEFYLKWMRMKYSLMFKRKRRVKQQINYPISKIHGMS